VDTVRDREVKTARDQGCFIVSPHWLMECSTQGCRVEEADYPGTYNPNMTLVSTVIDCVVYNVCAQTGLTMPKVSSSQAHPIPDIPHSNTQDRNGLSSCSGSDTTGSEEPDVKSSEAAKQLEEHLEQIQAAPSEQIKRRRSRRLLSKEETLEETNHRKSPSRKGRMRRGRRKEEQSIDSQVTDSQLLQVTYDDPTGRKERERLLAKVQR